LRGGREGDPDRTARHEDATHFRFSLALLLDRDQLAGTARNGPMLISHA